MTERFPTRRASKIPGLLPRFSGFGLKSGRIRGVPRMLPARLAAFVAVRGLQRLFWWVDPSDRERIDPFGWSVVAPKG